MWLSSIELSKRLGMTRPSVYRMAKKRGWGTKLVAMPGGGNCKLYDVPGSIVSSVKEPEPIESKQTKTTSSDAIPDLRPKIDIPLDLQMQADLRARLCELIIEELDESESRMETWKSMTASYNAGDLLPELFRLEGKHGERTLRRWVKQYQAASKSSEVLIRSRKLGQPERNLTEVEKNFLLHLLLNPNCISIGSAIRKLKQMETLQKLESPSSERTLRSWCEEWRDSHKPEWNLLRNGKAFRSKLFNKQWEKHDLSKELVDIFPRLGIGVTFAKAYNARAKVVERFFRT